MSEDQVRCPGPAPGENGSVLVKQIDMGELEEFHSLGVLEAMLHQQLAAVRRCIRTTNEGVYNQFNSGKFLIDLGRVEAYVRREFPPKY